MHPMQHQAIHIDSFKDLDILVIGDAMIDRYVYGNIERQSPEAPVPIVDVKKTDDRLGGAANVALNISTLGAKSHLMSFYGNDENALVFKKLLKKNGICNILIPSKRKTTLKTRVYNKNTYVVRFDIEDKYAIDSFELDTLLKNIEKACINVPLDAIVLQDYNKGLLSKESIPRIIQIGLKHKIPIIVDPKFDNFFEYKNVDLFKPNLKEVEKALNISIDVSKEDSLKKICKKLLNRISCKNILVTAAEHGAMAANKNSFYKIPAQKTKVVDVSGAGDTVIAIASLLYASHYSLEDVLYFCNLAGSLAVSYKGVHALSIKELVNAIK